eukprot:snap_masked-scaffold_56-processed-gene-0.10-mRNA-1 protein AED:1.00 eAED:1.00 QI:0/-1/0/0/-1/1/1/0/361
MEVFEVNKVILKKACSRCVTLKRKCDSVKPTCGRCSKMGAFCSYERAKKRGKKKMAEKSEICEESLFNDEEQIIMQTFLLHDLKQENRLASVFSKLNQTNLWTWNIIESSAKTLSNSYLQFVRSPLSKSDVLLAASLLSVISTFFKKSSSIEFEVEKKEPKFCIILEKNNINLKEVRRILKKRILPPNCGSLASLAQKFFSYEDSNMFPLPHRLPQNKAFCRIFWEQEGEDFEIATAPNFEVNEEFKKIFGFGEELLKAELVGKVQSFILFGGSVLSFLTTERYLKNYLKAAEFQVDMMNLSLQENQKDPWDVRLPCSLIMQLETFSGEWKPFQVSSLSREIMTKTYYLGEVRLYFTPCDI